ncbi:MAG: hypothetical protein ABR987_03195 [Terracidiphilus sp.]|jgi:hypothetical protein
MPNFTSRHFDDLLTNPFGREVDEYSREGWFIYFYQEAKGRRDNKEAILEIMNELFVCPDEIRDATAYQMKAPYHALDEIPDGTLQGILDELLKIGFERIPLQSQPGRITDSSYDVAQAKIYYDVNEHVAAAWRGETRDWATIRTHGGTLTQANFEQRAVELNMRAEWHPFKDTYNRQYLWYRKGQNDNCKYSVVSLGNHFRVAANFPKLEDRVSWPGMPLSVDPSLFGIVKQEGEIQIQAMGNKKITNKYFADIDLISTKGPVKQLMIVTRVYVALVFRQGWIVNTHLKQVKSKGKVELDEALKLGKTPGFREIGSGDIPFKYYFGVVALIRVHHGSEDDNGFTACVDKTKSFHKSENDLLEIFADEQKAKDAYQKMMNLYNEWFTAAPFTNRWQGEGGFDDGPALMYQKGDTKMPATLMKIAMSDGSTWSR